MQLRWSALIALWTILSGPVFSGPLLPSSRVPASPSVSSSVQRGKALPISLQQLATQQQAHTPTR